MESMKEIERYCTCHEPESVDRFVEAQCRHQKVINQEEAFWKQHAKMHWLKDDDLNMKLFHMSAMARRKFKKIYGLENEE